MAVWVTLRQSALQVSVVCSVGNREYGILYPHTLIEKGAQWAASPKEVAEKCRLVLASLPGPPEFEAVVLGEEGTLTSAKQGDVFIDLTTNSPTTIRKVAAVAKARGVTILDAPVSGGIWGAEKADLTIMVGGDEETFQAYRQVLGAIGKHVFHLGEVGCGSLAKLCNQLIVLSTNCIVSEAFVLGVKAGIDPTKLWEAIRSGSGACYALEVSFPNSVFKGNFDSGFAIDLAFKDLDLATELGKELALPLPLATAALQRYVEAQARGMGKKNSQSVIGLLEQVAGVDVRIPPL